ncbi:MAG TPA: acyltransferase family protein [Gemmataceae bacterium]|nr:acyltransferase family protein [Gemmataceae bacterium]
MPPADVPDRYHGLDALRGFAMFLGVVLHAAIPYLHNPVPFWPVRDDHGSPLFDVFLLAVHDFRMQVFFLLAGFFGALLYARHGIGGTARHRLKRIALPFALAMVTIQPALQAVTVYAASAAYRENPAHVYGPPGFAEVLAAGDSPIGAVAHHFLSGSFLRYMVPAHLWFLWYLLIFFAVMLPLARVADRLRDRTPGRWWDIVTRRLFQSPLRWLLLAGVTWFLLLPMTGPGGIDTQLGWVPNVPLLVYYFLFFVVGWTLYRHRDQLTRFAAGWRFALVVGNLIVFPVGLVAFGVSNNPGEAGVVHVRTWHQVSLAALGLYTWLMVGGLLGLFLRHLSGERAWVRWLADSSYWCYLASVPPVILFQYAIVTWDVPAVVKFAAVTAATTAVLLASYHWLVRYSWIGRLLNGPRERQTRDAPAFASSAIPAVSGRITG